MHKYQHQSNGYIGQKGLLQKHGRNLTKQRQETLLATNHIYACKNHYNSTAKRQNINCPWIIHYNSTTKTQNMNCKWITPLEFFFPSHGTFAIDLKKNKEKHKYVGR
eukprot:TRINITY_DN15934_c0_g1_i1.p1 TRINITY_DN15934_c0_g1~~TRINITY_DN15934_c0_g1_i1.p1  ORF type:complete len:107 (-),score=8.25 TRINITY_DN15934_c0_g1_i1:51-371(-)